MRGDLTAVNLTIVTAIIVTAILVTAVTVTATAVAITVISIIIISSRLQELPSWNSSCWGGRVAEAGFAGTPSAGPESKSKPLSPSPRISDEV